jgi:hypothetical protein
MPARHLEFLVEEPSMEAFLGAWLPRHLPESVEFDVRVFQGKQDLLGKLEARLRGYSRWLPDSWRIVILIDRDGDDCFGLKADLEDKARRAGFATRRSRPDDWRVVTCLAIEELEAWYFGEWRAVVEAYPRISANIASQASYRSPDTIAGGTWEAFERIMQRSGYFGGGLEKVKAARDVGAFILAERNRSPSFQNLIRALASAIG